MLELLDRSEYFITRICVVEGATLTKKGAGFHFQ